MSQVDEIEPQYEHVGHDVKIALLSLFQYNTSTSDMAVKAVLEDSALEVFFGN
jgi:hypothetical protein